MMNMYEMAMLMIWDMNACLTPRGVTDRCANYELDGDARHGTRFYLGSATVRA
jgi:hypothetical protein